MVLPAIRQKRMNRRWWRELRRALEMRRVFALLLFGRRAHAAAHIADDGHTEAALADDPRTDARLAARIDGGAQLLEGMRAMRAAQHHRSMRPPVSASTSSSRSVSTVFLRLRKGNDAV